MRERFRPSWYDITKMEGGVYSFSKPNGRRDGALRDFTSSGCGGKKGRFGLTGQGETSAAVAVVCRLNIVLLRMNENFSQEHVNKPNLEPRDSVLLVTHIYDHTFYLNSYAYRCPFQTGFKKRGYCCYFFLVFTPFSFFLSLNACVKLMGTIMVYGEPPPVIHIIFVGQTDVYRFRRIENILSIRSRRRTRKNTIENLTVLHVRRDGTSTIECVTIGRASWPNLSSGWNETLVTDERTGVKEQHGRVTSYKKFSVKYTIGHTIRRRRAQSGPSARKYGV